MESPWKRLAFCVSCVWKGCHHASPFAFYDKMAAFVGMGMVADAMATLIRCLALAPVLFLYVLRIL